MSEDSPDPTEKNVAPIEGPVIVITGPTAGGKSALAVRLAQQFERALVSVDSMKVYRRMDIGSAKPSSEKLGGVPCHLIDIREPWDEFSVGDYLAELSRLARQLPRPLILAGGTAFYLYGLLEGVMEAPPAQPELREGLEARAQSEGNEALHRELAEKDPESAAKLHPNDRRRVIRALEVIAVTGELFSELQKKRRPLVDPEQVCLVGIAHSRKQLYRRIDDRVVRMFEAGWVEEVEQLRREHDPPWSASASQSIGYEQIREALELGENPEERLETIQQRTRHFARSQLTWFRKMPLRWWHPGELNELLAWFPEALAQWEQAGSWPAPDPARREYSDM